jgi:DnaJ-class molecular chaperone
MSKYGDWRDCELCEGTGLVTKIDGQLVSSVGEEEQCDDCPVCGGTGLSKRYPL